MNNRQFATVLDSVRKNDHMAFKSVVYEYSPRLMTVAKMLAKNTADAQDILQDSFVLVYKNIHQFEGNQEAAFYSWMKKILINRGLSIYKRKYYTHENNTLDLQWSKGIDPQVLHEFDRKDLMQVIFSLPPRYRQVVALYAIEGYSHSEIADILHIEESSSRSIYSRAKSKLKKLLDSMKIVLF